MAPIPSQAFLACPAAENSPFTKAYLGRREFVEVVPTLDMHTRAVTDVRDLCKQRADALEPLLQLYNSASACSFPSREDAGEHGHLFSPVLRLTFSGQDDSVVFSEFGIEGDATSFDGLFSFT